VTSWWILSRLVRVRLQFPVFDVTLIEAINNAAQKLSENGVSNARLDAELLLSHVLNKNRAWLITHIHDALEGKNLQFFEGAVDRRARREPLQYIIGKQEFWGLEFRVTPDVLIPRPETELIIESALAIARDRHGPLTIIDLCTGSGCIAVSLAKELPSAQIIATDTSEKALGVARTNARAQNVAERIRFFEGDLFEPLETLAVHGRVDIIVTNPPYIRAGDLNTLQAEVRDYEPETALIAGPDGTEVHRRIIGAAPHYLKPRGILIMEMGMGQSGALAAMIREQEQYGSFEVLKDLAGIERVLVARKR
jgi:release factor glutamine methyltransferase